MAGSSTDAHDGGWLTQETLDELAAISESSPDDFDERFGALDVLRRIQVRRFMFGRHKDGYGLPPALLPRPVDVSSLEQTSGDEVELADVEGDAPDILEEALAGDPAADDAVSLDDLTSADEPATEAGSLDDLMSDDDDGDAGSLDDLFADDSGASGDDAGSLDDLFGADESSGDGASDDLDALLGDDDGDVGELEEEASGGILPDKYGVPRALDMSADDVVAILEPLELYSGISHDDLINIANIMNPVEYGPDALLCRDGDEGDMMWVIVEGGVRVLPQGQDLGIVIPPGQFIGEMALLDGSPRSAALMTAGTTTLLQYTRDGFTTTFRDSPDAGLAFMENVVRRQQDRIRDTNSKAIEDAVARERAEGEIRQAEATQKLALPDAMPTFGDMEFAVVYTGARGVSGDYYDFIELEDDPDKLIVIFADSTGHGLNAGLLMLIARSAAFTQQHLDPSVAAITTAINNGICDIFGATLFMTYVCMLLDKKNCTIEYTNAGQQSHPYLYRMESGELVPLASQTFQLGIQPGAEYTSETVEYTPGDLLVCYSDGIIEAPYFPPGGTEVNRDIEFGDEKLEQLIRDVAHESPQVVIDRLQHDAYEWCTFFDGHETVNGVQWDGDDITNLVVRLN